MPVQTRNISQKDVVSELKNHLYEEHGKIPYLGIVHRLDQPVRGMLVFAKNEKAAGDLSRQIREGAFDKYYHAVVEGIVEAKERTVLEDYLIKTKDNTAEISDKSMKGAKKAVLAYTVLDTDTDKQLTMLDIELMTGRFHQIRSQLSNAGHPIAGDIKYGAKIPEPDRTIKLCAYRLCFDHPVTGKHEEYRLDDPEGFDLFFEQ